MHILFLLLTTFGLVSLVGALDHHDARRECVNLHSEPPHLNNSNDRYRNQGCRLTCTLMDQVVYIAHIHEGAPCPHDSAGICRNGECEQSTSSTEESVAKNTPTTTTATATIEPFRTARPYLNFYNLSMLEWLNTTIYYASLSHPQRDTYAAICLVPKPDSSIQDCRQMCRTNISPETNDIPEWNHQCRPLKAIPGMNYVLMGVWSLDHDAPISYRIRSIVSMLDYREYNRTSGIVFDYRSYRMKQLNIRLMLHNEFRFKKGGLK